MAKRNTTQKTDYTVLKVMIALILLVATLWILRAVAGVYSTIEGFDTVYPLTLVFAIGFGVLALASVAALLFAKNTGLKTAAFYVLPVSVLQVISALVLRHYLTDRMTLLYFINTMAYLLYAIYQLYGLEFTLISLLTCMAGWSFYRLFPGVLFNVPQIACTVIMLVLIAAIVFVSYKASQNKGCLMQGKKKIRLFAKSFQPMFLYVACGIWLVCLIGSLTIGALFAYYCLYAAVAFELIAAVYYTFQLK